MGHSGGEEKKEQRSQKREVDTWMSPEAGDEIKRKEGWVEGWALSLSCSPYGCVCVCVWSICALVLEEWNRGSARWTHKHTNDRFRPLASCNQSSPVLLHKKEHRMGILTFEVSTYEQKVFWHKKRSVQTCKVLQKSQDAVVFVSVSPNCSWRLLNRHTSNRCYAV